MSSGRLTSRPEASIRWWIAGGLHAHVKYPDGSWERRVWKLVADWAPYWEVDSLVLDIERRGYAVTVTP